ncbi:sensor histidine kinase [Saccharopolyspora dendranthemae]|uniref:histidine kinase n=1 Tax=Saccharopolyspora dendranthemae TaxID=1181886 RepID=A0A561U8Z0_9PSEU|nr:histidine kinase [Saccharopolyspora dendranthemae]TWF95807.1 signal transduction histidine kinase [Saccharopolyspora dendranthemae]
MHNEVPAEGAALPRPARHALTAGLCGALLFVWLLDLESSDGIRDAHNNWVPPLVAGVVAALLLLIPDRSLSLNRRSWIAAVGSLALTTTMLLTTGVQGTWGVAESLCLLILLGRACRGIPVPLVALPLGLAVITGPARIFSWDREEFTSVLSFSFLLTFAAGGVIGLGCYLRLLDSRRARAVESVRQGERLELARDLHDFVAHHVTGIVVQANAARAIRETAPEKIDAILTDIHDAGTETLDSMRRLVRVLREVDGPPRRHGELFSEIAALVSDFSSGDDQRATLSIAAAARGARLAPEVDTSVHRLVQESLTNARRHAPGAVVSVRIDLADDRLRVEVANTASAERTAPPVGGHGGFGVVGLRERVSAVDGTMEAGTTPDGGWRIAADFPVLGVPDSSA